jgi:23S rRNA pseudouridine2604 synthase
MELQFSAIKLYRLQRRLMEKTRINKYLSEVGYCSRRAADKLLEEGRIKINGKIPEMGTKVSDEDIVEVDGKPIREPQE